MNAFLFMPPWPKMPIGVPEREARAAWVKQYAAAILKENRGRLQLTPAQDEMELAMSMAEFTFREASNT